MTDTSGKLLMHGASAEVERWHWITHNCSHSRVNDMRWMNTHMTPDCFLSISTALCSLNQPKHGAFVLIINWTCSWYYISSHVDDVNTHTFMFFFERHWKPVLWLPFSPHINKHTDSWRILLVIIDVNTHEGEKTSTDERYEICNWM